MRHAGATRPRALCRSARARRVRVGSVAAATVALAVASFVAAAPAATQQSGELHLQRGVELLAAGRTTEAVRELERAVALLPRDPRARYQLGLALFTAGRAVEAEEHLEVALEVTNEAGPVQFLLGQVLLETGDLEAANAALEAAATSRAGYPPIDFYRAELCYRLGRVDTARDRFAALAAAAPDWTAPLLRSGTLALEQGEPSAAVQWFNSALEISPEDAAAWMRLGTALVDAEQPYEALAAYRRAAEVAPDYTTAFVSVAVQLINLDEHEEAIAAINAVLGRDPDHGIMRYHLARLISRAGNHAAALTELEVALADLRASAAGQPPGSGAGRSLAEALLLRAELLMELGREEEAVELARELVAGEPDYPEALFLLGNALMRRGDRSGADFLQRFRALSDAREHRRLGEQYRLRDKDLERARAEYERALQALPGDAGSLLGLGSVQRQTGQPTQAVETLGHAGQAGADGGEWHREWVLALQAAGRSVEARQAWQDARARGLVLGPAVWALMHQALGGC